MPGGVGRVDPLRDDPFDFKRAGMIVEGPPVRDLVIAVVQTGTCIGQQGAKALLPLAERFRGDGFAIEVQDIEEEKDERVGVTGVRCVLDQAKRRDAVRTYAAQLSVEIGLSRRKRRDRSGDRRVFTRPVEPGSPSRA